MLVDIFSSFDPATSTLFSSPLVFWLSLLLLFPLLTSTFWMSTGFNSMISSPLKHFMSSQLFLSPATVLKSMPGLITPLFAIIVIMNMSGLNSYYFGFTTHLLLTLSMGLPLWLLMIMSSWATSTSTSAGSLLPGGAPSWLNPALILIETISLLVRPITLSFRLAANISAGHIILGLLNFYVMAAVMSTPISFISLMIISTGYTLFEMGICLVQAYIFCLLLTLYADDHAL